MSELQFLSSQPDLLIFEYNNNKWLPFHADVQAMCILGTWTMEINYCIAASVVQ